MWFGVRLCTEICYVYTRCVICIWHEYEVWSDDFDGQESDTVQMVTIFMFWIITGSITTAHNHRIILSHVVQFATMHRNLLHKIYYLRLTWIWSVEWWLWWARVWYCSTGNNCHVLNHHGFNDNNTQSSYNCVTCDWVCDYAPKFTTHDLLFAFDMNMKYGVMILMGDSLKFNGQWLAYLESPPTD